MQRDLNLMPSEAKVLQIGFNFGLNFRGYNYNPLIPSQRVLNYGPSRRYSPNSYLSLPSSKSPASDSDQSDSEDLSLEDFNYRKNSEYNNPYLRQNENLRYSSVADNSASLESSPVGEVGTKNFAELYRSLRDRNRAEEDARRSYIKDRLSAFRRGNNIYQKEESNLSVEEPSKDEIRRRDFSEHKPAAPPEDKLEESAYFQSLLTLMERPNSRRDVKRRYRVDDDDSSFESSTQDKVNFDDDDGYNRRTLFDVDLDNPESAEALLTNIEVPENRRVNVKHSVVGKPLNYEKNNDALTSKSLEQPDNRRRSKKGGSLGSDKHIEMPSPEKDGPDAYLDTVLLMSGDGKPDDIAVARPQLRNSKNSNLTDSGKVTRKLYTDLNLDVLSNNGVEDKPLKALPAIENSKIIRRNNKPVNNRTVWTNKKTNRKDGNNAKNAKLSPANDSDDKLSTSSLAKVNNLESLRKSNNENPKNNRRIDFKEAESPAVALDDRTDPDDDIAALDLSELLVNGLDNLHILPNILRSNGLSNSKNDKNDYKLALDTSESNTDAEYDSLSNLSILRSLSMDNKDELVPPTLANREPKTVNNKTLLSSRRVDDNVGVEVVLTDKLDSDDKAVDELVPYHEINRRKDKLSLLENVNARNNDEIPLELPLNSRRSHDNLDLSVLSLPSLDNQESLKKVEPPYLNKNEQISRRGYKKQNNIDEIIREIFETDLDAKNNDAANLRQGNNKNDGKNSILHLEYPWNNELTDDKSNRKLSSKKRHNSRRTDNYPKDRINAHSRKNNADLQSERSLNNHQHPYNEDKIANDKSRRRPHLRLRHKKNDDKRQVTSKRRANAPETNTAAPTADVLTTSEPNFKDVINSTKK
ncbi:unnamed protein product [Chrysodeixis includens]|uniref:Uncharacterized protein n=1 Tax=Chrysodeixis includens TaxID=689277 RepID=A0A9N8Q1E4_CHRIL|nr:unnamed protein product [Chrysodeixis includens]